MVNNQTPLSEARSFADAMGKFAQGAETGEKGYIKREGSLSGGFTYRFISGTESKSGKMNARDIVSTANRIAEYAQSTIRNSGELKAEELINIQKGMNTLQSRIRQHRATFFQKAATFTRLANDLLRPDYKKTLEDVIKGLSVPQLTESDRSAIVARALSDGKAIKESRQECLVEKFRDVHRGVIDKLSQFENSNPLEAINQNTHLKSIEKTAPDPELSGRFKTEFQRRLVEKCRRKKLSNVSGDAEFRALIRSYQRTCPNECRGKNIVQIVLEAGLPNFNRFKCKRNPQSRALVPPPQEVVRWGEEVLKRVPMLKGKEGPDAALNQQMTVNLMAIASSVGIHRDPETEPLFQNYLRTSIWGALVGNIRELPENMRPSESDLQVLEAGADTLCNMYSFYELLKRMPDDDASIVQLRSDLERSIPFALEASVVGGHHEYEDQLSQRMVAELSKMVPGQTLFLPIGCEDHATMLMMTKKEGGKVEIQHINTGFGFQEHRKLAGSKAKYPLGISFEIDLKRAGTQENLQDALCYFMNVSKLPDTTPRQISRGLRELHSLAGTGEIKVSIQRKKPQQTGNCSYRCLMEGMRKNLGEEKYRKFKLQIIDDYTSKLSEQRSNTQLDRRLLAGLSHVRKRTAARSARS